MTRLADRNRMMQKHNDRLSVAERIGVKVKGTLVNGLNNLQPSVGSTTYNAVSDFQNSKARDTSPEASFMAGGTTSFID